MLRKSKVLMIGSDITTCIKTMDSDNIYRNFEPEQYMSALVESIRTSDIPDFENSCAYSVCGKMIKFDKQNIDILRSMEYIISKADLFDYIYLVNTWDYMIHMSIGGDCVSDDLKVRGINMAPRTIIVLKLDRHNDFEVHEDKNGDKKKMFKKNISDVNFNLEYNIYMTRLL